MILFQQSHIMLHHNKTTWKLIFKGTLILWSEDRCIPTSELEKRDRDFPSSASNINSHPVSLTDNSRRITVVWKKDFCLLAEEFCSLSTGLEKGLRASQDVGVVPFGLGYGIKLLMMWTWFSSVCPAQDHSHRNVLDCICSEVPV